MRRAVDQDKKIEPWTYSAFKERMEEAGETAAREVENQLEESGPMKMKAH